MPKYADLIGQRFGKLTVVRKTTERYKRCVVWECVCDCGKHKKASTAYLRQGVITSCGCAYLGSHDKFSQMRFNDLSGKKFGKLLVIKKVPSVTERRRALWECQCECGAMTVVSSGYLLNKSQAQSCGCSHEHRLNRKQRYESIVGERVPDGHYVIFLDGNINNWDKSNLYHISNATRQKMIYRHWFYDDADRTLTAIKICELEAEIKTKKQSL